MNLISLSIRRPVFAWVLMAAMIVFGAICLNRLGTSQLPDVDFPILNISVNYEGAAPEVVEAEIIDPIEQNLLQIEGIQQMRSSVRQGGGSVRLDFDINRDVDVALQEVQAALSQVRLPADVDPPVIRKQNPEESPIIFMAVSSDKPLREMMSYTENVILDQFRFLPGIGEVSVGGFSARNLRIWPDMQKLARLDLTIADVISAVESQHFETAAGQFVEDDKELRVRWLGEAASAEEVGELPILQRGGATIHGTRIYRIKDVAEVEDDLSDIRRMARVDGKPAISISVRKQRGSNEVAVAEAVRNRVKEVAATLPEGYKLQINVDFSAPTKAVVDTTYDKLIMAGLVTILICFLFLGSWQAAVNILFSIPTSIVGTFTILYFSGFTLNLFTLLALTLAISIVVDDAIMLLENIVRHHRMGKNAAQAAYDGAMEIMPAATAATFAVIAVFIPVIFMSGIIGKFFFQFGVTMSAAVLLSLVEAVTITPMRAAALMSTESRQNRFETYLEKLFGGLAAAYARVLERALRYSKTIVFASLVLFVASLAVVKGLRQEFVPTQDQNIIMLSGQTPTGSSLEVTHAKALEIEKIIKTVPEIERYFVNVGAGGPSSEVNQFTIPMYLKPREERSVRHSEIMDQLREKFKAVKGARISFRDISARGLTSGRQNPISFNLSGPELSVLVKSADQIIDRLEKEGLAVDMDTDFKVGLPELLIKPDREAMAAHFVSIEAVGQALNSAVAGIRSSRFTSGGRRYDVRVKVRDQKITSPKDIEHITVRNQYGNLVPLSRLVKFEESKTYQSITRVNRQRAIGVFGNLQPGKSQGAVLNRAREIASEILPDNYTFQLEGAAAGLQESFQSLGMALLMGIVVAFMILAVQFNSFVHPISVLVALPFSATGALLVLWLSGTSLNLFSFIGLIVLMGIAKKNSILLVEFTNHVRQHGEKDIKKALIEACPIRLRPILMTSVATVVAAFPLIIGNSIGQETRTPMGLTIIGGTIVSTIFTLVVVPCLYYLLTWFESKKVRPKLVTDTDPHPTEHPQHWHAAAGK